MGSCPYNHMTLWSRGFLRSPDKLISSYLQYHSSYDHQIWEDRNLPWWAPAYTVIWTFNHVVLWDHVTNLNHYISTSKVFMATKPGKMLTYLDGLVSIMQHDRLITLSCRITWQKKNHYIFTTSVPMATKLGRTVTYLI